MQRHCNGVLISSVTVNQEAISAHHWNIRVSQAICAPSCAYTKQTWRLARSLPQHPYEHPVTLTGPVHLFEPRPCTTLRQPASKPFPSFSRQTCNLQCSCGPASCSTATNTCHVTSLQHPGCSPADLHMGPSCPAQGPTINRRELAPTPQPQHVAPEPALSARPAAPPSVPPTTQQPSQPVTAGVSPAIPTTCCPKQPARSAGPGAPIYSSPLKEQPPHPVTAACTRAACPQCRLAPADSRNFNSPRRTRSIGSGCASIRSDPTESQLSFPVPAIKSRSDIQHAAQPNSMQHNYMQ